MFLSVNIEELIQDILVSRKITGTDRTQLKDLLLSSSLSQNDHILLDRLFYGVRKGLVEVEC